MTPAENAVHIYARQVSHKSGIFYMDGRSVAEQFEGLSKSAAYRITNHLKQKGWLREVPDEADRSPMARLAEG